jgi:3D (Asp-Asp-Asp) domain-containing protein
MKFRLLWSLGVLLSLSVLVSVNVTAQTAEPGEQGEKARQEEKTTIVSPDVKPAFPELIYTLDLHPSKFNNVVFDEPRTSRLTNGHSFEATAYSLRGRTASGEFTRSGVVAADPNVLPIGSVVEIEAGTYSGVYVVHDTGARVKGNLVDVWVPSYKAARQFGRRNVKLTVLKYGPNKRVKNTQP